VTRPATLPGVKHAYHLFPVWSQAVPRDDLILALKCAGVGVVVNYRAIHLLTYFRDTFGFRRGQFPNAERIGDCTLSLPFYPNMPHEHADRVVAALRETARRAA